jgi:hypothetical protein
MSHASSTSTCSSFRLRNRLMMRMRPGRGRSIFTSPKRFTASHSSEQATSHFRWSTVAVSERRLLG